MSLTYDIFASMESEAADHTPKTIGSAVDNFHAYFKEFKEKAEEVSGRLYAMIKKLNGEGAVHTEIKYLKARLLDNPSQLVINVSEHIQNEIIFNEKVCKYDTKTLNHPIAKRCCEQHVQAIKQLLDNEKSFDTILKNAASTKDKSDDKVAIQMLRNLKQVSKHLLWSSRRLLANVRLHQSSNEVLESKSETKLPEFVYIAGDEDSVKAGYVQYGLSHFDKEMNIWQGEFVGHRSPSGVKAELKKSKFVHKKEHYAFGLPTTGKEENFVLEKGKIFFRPKKEGLKFMIKDMKVIDLGDMSKDELPKDKQ